MRYLFYQRQLLFMEQIISLLNGIYPLEQENVDYLCNILENRKTPRKTLLLKRGQVCRHVYFIKKGLIRAYYLRGNNEVCTWFMKEGDVVLSVGSFYTQQPSRETIETLEETELYYISNTELQQMYQLFPGFNFIGRVLTEKYYLQAEERQIALQLPWARQRYAYFMEHHSELVKRVPGKYIASYLGTTQENLSRTRSKRL